MSVIKPSGCEIFFVQSHLIDQWYTIVFLFLGGKWLPQSAPVLGNDPTAKFLKPDRQTFPTRLKTFPDPTEKLLRPD